MHQALAYGCHVASNAAIPGLVPADSTKSADLRVFFDEAPPWGTQPDDVVDVAPPDETAYATGRINLRYPDGTRFWLDIPAASIWTTWPDPLTLEDTATYLLGPVMGLYLRLRGHVCLHASAIVLDGAGVAFVGAAGSGKSTLAAGFATLGVPTLTEDVCCLDERDGAFSIRPGYPLIRLWEGGARLLPVPDLPLLTPNWDKRYLALRTAALPFQDEPRPLARVFVLQERRSMTAAAEIAPLGGQDTLSQLVANTYGQRLLSREMRAREFEVLGRLARTVAVRALALNAEGSRLLEACEWIRRHALT